MSDVNHDARAIFFQALDRPSPAELVAFLDRACGQNAELRARVEDLLKAHRKAGKFLGGSSASADATDLRPITEQPGDTIGPYKLLQQIGEGGMGTVFMAEQTEPVERRVALKIIKPGMDSQQVIARFEAERQALAMMDHPNIAKVLDAGTTNSGRPYFVMELVQGVPITEFCDQQHLPPKERLELFIPICQAVQHAHQKGIIHRDLKPSNILVAQYDGKPVPKVIDFGVAKAIRRKLTEKTMFTQYGQIVGTVDYMSPEQAQFNELDVDTRSDVYSLGVLLYELLTGETPFDKERLRSAAFDELLRIIRDEEPPKPSTRLSSSETLATTAANRKTEPKKLSLLVRGELDWIVMKALEKDRARRHQTASAFAADVEHYLHDEAVTACPPTRGYRFRKFVRRNRAVFATVAMVAGALLAGIAGTTWQAIRATDEANEAVAARRIAEAAEDRLQVQKVAARRSELHARRSERFWTHLYRARWARYSGSRGQRHDALRAIAEASRLAPNLNLKDEDNLELRNEAIAAMALTDLEMAKTLEKRTPRFHSVTCDAGLKRFAYRAADVAVVRNFADFDEIIRFADEETGCPFLSADGRFAVIGNRHRGWCRLWDVNDKRPVMENRLPYNELAVSFRPASTIVAVGGHDRKVRFIDLPSGSEEIAPLTLAGYPRMIRFSPGGSQLGVVLCQENSFAVWDLATRQVREYALPSESHCLAWSPDGSHVAIGCSDCNIYNWDLHEGRRQRVMSGHEATVTRLQYHRDGQLLASEAWDGTVRLWDAVTGNEMVISQDTHLPHYSHGDFYFVSQSFGGEAVIYGATPPTGFQRFPGRLDDISPDSRLLVSVDRGEFQLWSIGQRRPLAKLPTGWYGSSASFDLRAFALFHPKGDCLITVIPQGVVRWAFEWDADRTLLRIGPPELLCKSPIGHDCHGAVALSADGGWLAYVSSSKEVTVLNLMDPTQVNKIATERDVTAVSISRDGRWVAINSWEIASGAGYGFEIWNVVDGTRVQHLAGGGGGWWSRIKFSRDGKWLAGGPSEYRNHHRLWKTGTWDLVGQMPGGESGACSFSPDGRILACDDFNGHARVIRLRDMASGKDVANLEPPDSHRFHRRFIAIRFGGDGSVLGVCDEHGATYVWDLREIRRKLVGFGLDWDLPSYPERFAQNEPVSVEVDLGFFVEDYRRMVVTAVSQARRGQWTDAEATFSKVVRQDPLHHWNVFKLAALRGYLGDSTGHQSLCQETLTRFGDTSDLGVAERTAKACLILPHDETIAAPCRALLELASTSSDEGFLYWVWTTQDLAAYRAGDWSAAVESCTKVVNQDWEPRRALAFSVLAMAHYQLGETEKASVSLNNARNLLDPVFERLDRGEELPENWYDWLYPQIIRREAEKLIESAD